MRDREQEKAASQASAPSASSRPVAEMPLPPLDAGRAGRHDDRGRDHAPADRAALEQRAGEGEHDRHAAHDHADRGRVGLAHALDHEQVEEHEAGGREGDQPGKLAPCEARQPPARDREQREAREGVAKRLAGGERIGLNEVGRGDQRADQGERGSGQQGSAHGGAHRQQRMLLLVR